jgi:hypothetical protein
MQAVGVLGNSGDAGASLVRVTPRPGACGAAVDRDGTLWLSGGECINRVALDGRLIEAFPLEPAGSAVDSRAFAVLDETLYFLGTLPNKNAALFALPMAPPHPNSLPAGARGARALPVKLPPKANPWEPLCLAHQPLHGQLVLAAGIKESGGGTGVFFVNPKTSEVQRAFVIPGRGPHGVAVDEKTETIYVGATTIFAAKPGGTLLPGFPVACTKTPALPTSFNGVVSLANGALWETAWYGFLSRLDLKGNGAPGRIVQWHHDLDYPMQVLGLSASGGAAVEPLLITTAGAEAHYFAHWDNAAQELRLVRRIGCLPQIFSLGISDDGWITVGTARSQLWWKWEDGGDAPARQADIHIACTPGFFRGEEFFALARVYHVTDGQNKTAIPIVFSRRVQDRNEGRRVGEWVPMKQPVGMTVQLPAEKRGASVLVSDAASKQLWRAPFHLPNLTPENKWEAVPVAVDAAPSPQPSPPKGEGAGLLAPTDIVALRDGRVLLADEGRVLLLEPCPNGYKAAVLFRELPDGAGALGKRLCMAADGAWLLVSDTDRQRVVWLDWMEKKLLGVFGETDKPGDDARHLNGPTFVALSGTHAVIADAGNQRVVKVVLKP